MIHVPEKFGGHTRKLIKRRLINLPEKKEDSTNNAVSYFVIWYITFVEEIFWKLPLTS